MHSIIQSIIDYYKNIAHQFECNENVFAAVNFVSRWKLSKFYKLNSSAFIEFVMRWIRSNIMILLQIIVWPIQIQSSNTTYKHHNVKTIKFVNNICFRKWFWVFEIADNQSGWKLFVLVFINCIIFSPKRTTNTKSDYILMDYNISSCYHSNLNVFHVLFLVHFLMN